MRGGSKVPAPYSYYRGVSDRVCKDLFDYCQIFASHQALPLNVIGGLDDIMNEHFKLIGGPPRDPEFDLHTRPTGKTPISQCSLTVKLLWLWQEKHAQRKKAETIRRG